MLSIMTTLESLVELITSHLALSLLRVLHSNESSAPLPLPDPSESIEKLLIIAPGSTWYPLKFTTFTSPVMVVIYTMHLKK